MPPTDLREIRTVTILFSDLSGFTAMSEQLDPEEVTDIVDGLFRRFRPLIESRGGTIDKFIGDAVMAVFGAPAAHEDDAARAVGAGLAMQKEIAAFNAEHGLELRMRVGIHTGPVLWGSIGGARPTATGDAVVVAQRLEATAKPGSVHVSVTTARTARRRFRYLRRAQVELKGRPLTIEAFEAEESHSGTGVLPPETPFAGRAAERARLLEAWDSGRGAFVFLEGEPGAGKSRLAGEVRRAVRARSPSAWVATGAASDSARAPFAALGQALRSVLGAPPADPAALTRYTAEIADAMAATEPDAVSRENTAHLLLLSMGIAAPGARVTGLGPARLEEEVRAAWSRWLASRSPALVVIEDLHLADDATFAVLQSLPAIAAGRPLFVLATARPGARRLPGFEILSLGDLPREDVLRIATSVLAAPLDPALEEFLANAAGGNPFYAEELSRFLLEEHLVEGRPLVLRAGPLRVPSGLEGLLVARLDGLGTDHRETLKGASVLGPIFWAGLLGNLLERDVAEAVETARQHDMVRAGGDSRIPGDLEFAFRHALLRDAAYSLLTKKDRARLHEAAAALLEQKEPPGGRVLLAMAARHREAAGQPEAAARDWLEAAKRAFEADFMAEAAQEARESSRCASGAEAHLLAARALIPLGEWGDADAELRKAASHPVPLVCDPWRLPLALANLRFRTADYSRALDLSAEALAGCTDSLGRAKCLRTRVDALVELGRHEEALAALAQAEREIAGRTDRASVECLAGIVSERALIDQKRGAFEAALQGFLSARDTVRSIGQRDRGASHTIYVASTLDRLGRTQEALAAMREALEDMRSTGNRSGVATCTTNIGLLLYRLRDYAGAAEAWSRALPLQRDLGNPAAVAITLTNMAMSWNREERHVEALGLAREALEICSRIGNRALVASALTQTGLALLGNGDVRAARAALEEALAIRRDLRDRWGAARTVAELADLALEEKDHAAAERFAREALADFRALNARHDVPSALRLLAKALRMAGRDREAEEAEVDEGAARRELDQAKLGGS